MIERQLITITRQGQPVGHGSYWVKLCRRSSRVHGREGPMIAGGQSWEFLLFDDIAAPVQTGDLAASTDGTLWTIYEARSYSRSLQVDLQRILGLIYNAFTPSTVSASIDDTTGNVKDVVYSPSTPCSLLVYLEPMAASDKILTNIGRADTRMAYGYSIAPITTGQVLSLNSEYWFADRESDFWPLIGVYRTNFRRLINKPVGVP